MKDLLYSEPYRFAFFQAVRLLERTSPGKEGVGRAVRPGNEIVRFRSHPSLAFPPSEIVDLKAPPPGQEDRPPEMTINFIGLTGPQGILPLSLHGARPRADLPQGHRPLVLLRHLQPPDRLALLPGLGEVPLPDRLREAGRGRLHRVPLRRHRHGNAGPPRPDGGEGPGAPPLRRAPRAEAALGRGRSPRSSGTTSGSPRRSSSSRGSGSRWRRRTSRRSDRRTPSSAGRSWRAHRFSCLSRSSG